MRILSAFLVFFSASLLRAAEPSLIADSVNWGMVKIQGASVTLPGTFSFVGESPFTWKLIKTGQGPMGIPIHTWELAAPGHTERALLTIMDVRISAVAEKERDAFMDALMTGYKKSETAGMEKEGFKSNSFEIVAYPEGGQYARHAASSFQKADKRGYQLAYAFPRKRVYLVSYMGTAEKPPKWFSDMLSHFTGN